MTKPDFSDFYKFISSLGIALLSFAFLLPWLFLRESFSTDITVEEISKLTPEAQTVILTKQSTALWFVSNVRWISSIIAIIGILFFLMGAYLWWKKQKSIDEIDVLKTEELKLKVKSMTPEEIAIKTIKEVEALEIRERGTVQKELPTVGDISAYLQLESTIISKFEDCFRELETFVLTRQRVGNNEFDVILYSSAPFKADVLIEIKIVREKPSQQWILDTVEQMDSAKKNYKVRTERVAMGMLFIIISPEYKEYVQSPSFQDFLSKSTEKPFRAISVKFYTEVEIKNFGCSDMHAIINGTK